MDEKYAIQVIFDEPDKKNRVGYLCYSWLKECYYLTYELLNCNLYYSFKETVLNNIEKDKEFIIDNIEGINDRKIISMNVVKVKAEIVR